MYYVYIIKSSKNGKLYIGYTANLKERMIKHNSATEKSTKAYAPWKLVYYEAYKSESDARKRELRLKDFGKAYGQLKRRMTDSLSGT
ncbi:MAG TPA: GIY-YIG nuclease family protein [Patescibacteria group bacterium]|nr:GIY-YIG nuclease family protein [Patescibacteria group bacterium]